MKKDISNQVKIDLLIKASQNGDSESFAKIYDVFIEPIYKYIYFKVPAQEAEDLTETVFLKAWQNVRKYRPGKHSFKAWIFRIAHNTVIDFYRTQKEHLELDDKIEDEKSVSDPKRITKQVLLKERLHGALKNIPDKQKEVIVLKYINGHDNSEISKIMGKSEGAVRVLQNRALKSLRKYLEKA